MVEMQPAPEGPVDPAMAPCPSPKDADREGLRRRRVLWGAVGVVVVLALLLGAGGWLWRPRPSATSRSAASASPSITRVLLPTGIGEGDIVSLGGATRAPETKAGRLEAGGMRVEQNQWIGSVYWTPKGGKSTKYELHLGESVHIDGLGTVTLLAVNPRLHTPDKGEAGGWTTEVHVNLDPGLHWCRKWDPC